MGSLIINFCPSVCCIQCLKLYKYNSDELKDKLERIERDDFEDTGEEVGCVSHRKVYHHLIKKESQEESE